MTDPTPHDLCPQREHAPGPKPLSPAAQAVRRDISQIMYELHQCCRISVSATDTLPITLETTEAGIKAGINSLCAAAICALADQVVPERLLCTRTAEERTLYHEGRLDAAIRFRAEILAIATELEGRP